MPATDTLQQHAAHLARFVNETCSRTLNHFAQEARLDGETLQQAVERYEIDYAWHVLGAPVTRERSTVNRSSDNPAGRAVGSSLAIFARPVPARR